MFSWSGCPFCKRAKAVLDATGAKYTALELDQMADGAPFSWQILTLSQSEADHARGFGSCTHSRTLCMT